MAKKDRVHPLSGVHHVAVNVSDLERSVAFYEQALGYRTTIRLAVADPRMERIMRLPRGTSGRTATLQAESWTGQIELVEWTMPGSDHAADSVRRGPNLSPGVLLLSFEVVGEAIQETYERLAGLTTCYAPPEAVSLGDYGSVTMFLAEDPDGTVLEFVVLPGR